MATSSWREPRREPEPGSPPWEARCSGCGGWIVTAPSGTKWVRARCGNKRCRRYGEGQTVYDRRRT